MDLSAIAARQFSERNEELLSVEVPQWKDETGQPVKIYFRASLPFSQRQKIIKLASEGEAAKSVVLQFILSALDADGNRLLREASLSEVMHTYDPDIVSDIVIEMRKKSNFDEDEFKKN